jgi:hypothetical protein
VLLPVTYADAELVVVEYLRPLIDPVPIGLRVPNPRPDKFVNIRRVGGTADRVIDVARIDLFAWALTDQDAQDLAMTLRRYLAAMPGVRGGVRVVRVEEFAGPMPAPDDSNQPRWLVTDDISLRGVA